MKAKIEPHHTGSLLLLTATIAPYPNISKIGYPTQALDPLVRLKSYLSALMYYITLSDFENIVFCENSNYHSDALEGMKDLAKKYNKKLEILQFDGDHQKTLDKGYGYGEGECLDYAFDHSILLKQSASWYKITGRYVITNINEIIDQTKGDAPLFFRWMGPLAFFCVSTAFFKTNHKIYKKYLYNIKEKMNHHTTIEAEFYYALRRCKDNLGHLPYLPQKIKSKIISRDERKRYHKILHHLNFWDLNTRHGKILDYVLYKRK